MPIANRTKFQVRSDAAKQRWVRDDRKEAFWRKQIERWKTSGLSKRAFCESNNLSASSFNAWNREIGLRDREKVKTANAEALLNSAKNPFLPIRLVPDAGQEETPTGKTIDEPASPSSPAIEILVPGGAIIRVAEGAQVDYISQLFSTLKS
jgi:hypothetical protein